MKTLLQFLARYSILLLFLLLETVAFILLVRHNSYPQSAFLTSANKLSAGLYEINSSITGYFGLRKQNNILMDENAELRNRVNTLENQLEYASLDSAITYIHSEKNIEYRAAKVINASTNQQRNYLTINKGKVDGVDVDMGVISKDGVVGIISSASDHFAVIIPILNPLLSVSCKLKKNGYVGSLHWNGRDYRYASLIDIARHIEVEEGDTVLTSGLSEVFPGGMPVGVVDKVELSESDAYYKIRVRLAVNFRNLEYVTVIENKNRLERLYLEKEAKKE